MSGVAIVIPMLNEATDPGTWSSKGPTSAPVVEFLGRERRRDDLPRVGIHANVQFAPEPARLGAVLLAQPLPSQALGLMQGEAEHGPERQRRQDRQAAALAQARPEAPPAGSLQQRHRQALLRG